MNIGEATQKNLEGLELLKACKYDEAITLFNESIEIDSEYPTPWLNRSETNRKLGREVEANADKEKWRTLMSKDQEPIVTYGKDQEPIVTYGIEETLASTEEYAGFWVRAGAYIMDIILVNIFLIFSFWLLLVRTLEPKILSEALIFVLFIIALTPFWLSLYSWLFIGLKGQTLGKMLFHIKVINAHGDKPGLGRAFLREVLGKLILIFLILLFVYFSALLGFPQDERNQDLHDKIAGTYVIKVPSQD